MKGSLHHVPSPWCQMLKALREEAGLSQRALAAKAGICRSTLRRFEVGLATGDLPILERILDALGYELDVVVKTVPATKPRPKEQTHALH